MKLLDYFKLTTEKEKFETVSENIHQGVVFKGTNLWILIFAIFIASLGLNVNSTAVIIGAMLISPLMGPIMGLGFGMAVNDLDLLKKSFFSYLFAAAVALATSTIYFLISPINSAHSEILARTSPNIYDVLIAFFGGLAGTLAASSRLKGNVIPGVAIATALMPPLCTAGYGMATLQIQFFFGAFYLFIINSVFIALATLLTIRYLKFPFKHLPTEKEELKAKRMVSVIVVVTLLPSVYFGYDIVMRNRYEQKANLFIDNEAVFSNDYLLNRKVDAKNKSIVLTYGGQVIEDADITNLKSKLLRYDLKNTSLEIRQGFAYLDDQKNSKKENEQVTQLTITLSQKEQQVKLLQDEIDSLTTLSHLSNQVYHELKIQYPTIQSFILQKGVKQIDTVQHYVVVAVIKSKQRFYNNDRSKIQKWLKVRLSIKEPIEVYYE